MTSTSRSRQAFTKSKEAQELFRNKIGTYLVSNSFCVALERKDLENPSKSKFKDIFTFLAQKMTKSAIEINNFEKDIITILKTLDFPHKVSLVSLKSVGTITTWHNLLYILNWMVEVLGQNENASSVVDC